MKNRAERRHHHKRMVAKAKTFTSLQLYKDFMGKDWFEKQVKQQAETPAPCSCDMCGNPRRRKKEKTLAEKRAILTLHDYD